MIGTRPRLKWGRQAGSLLNNDCLSGGDAGVLPPSPCRQQPKRSGGGAASTGPALHHYSASSKGAAGFTLIELLVALAIFSIVILIVLSIFSRFVFVQRRDIGEQAVQEDMRFALEFFNREVRLGFGSTYEIAADTVAFRNQNGECVSYRFAEQRLERAVQAEAETVSCAAASYGVYEALTSTETVIELLRFSGRPAEAAGEDLLSQGYITISIVASARQKAEKQISLQSTVVARQVVPFGSSL